MAMEKFRADLVVFEPDNSRSVVVEVKRNPAGCETGIRQMKSFMAGNHCPVGLFVTPQQTRIFRDSYESYEADSVLEVGRYPTAKLLGLEKVPMNERALVDAVAFWLEQLSSGSADSLREEVRDDVSLRLLHSVTGGRVEYEVRWCPESS